ncbi:hypothetical protein [Thiomonas sp. FB-Cd]|uniref:hypothetical protein n=1 Tax=Thiomonas sp. FB-Cd TaxID=1158292 RepID=UPI000B05593F|nr:hypothetical protein [Thiomonas sp. FB-Cd]
MLEEAAGVSKYKERRRETENRLLGTRENLLRVNDILRELESQLDKLEQQAAVAQNFRRLQEQLETSQHGLWLLRWREAQDRQDRIAQDSTLALNALEAKTSELRAAESELEALRQAQYAATDALGIAQANLYAAQAEVRALKPKSAMWLTRATALSGANSSCSPSTHNGRHASKKRCEIRRWQLRSWPTRSLRRPRPRGE